MSTQRTESTISDEKDETYGELEQSDETDDGESEQSDLPNEINIANVISQEIVEIKDDDDSSDEEDDDDDDKPPSDKPPSLMDPKELVEIEEGDDDSSDEEDDDDDNANDKMKIEGIFDTKKGYKLSNAPSRFCIWVVIKDDDKSLPLESKIKVTVGPEQTFGDVVECLRIREKIFIRLDERCNRPYSRFKLIPLMNDEIRESSVTKDTVLLNEGMNKELFYAKTGKHDLQTMKIQIHASNNVDGGSKHGLKRTIGDLFGCTIS
jgi:hypothetical protein